MSWLRRTVPPGYESATLALKGTSPLLMNSPEADRDGELYRAFEALAQKTGKTRDDEARLRELEWLVRIYLDDELGPYVPGRMVKETLRAAATKWKQGENLRRSLVVVPYRVPLIYEGPRDQAGLWAAGYRFTTMVTNGGRNRGRVLRTRPMFPEWAIEVELAYDPEDIDLDRLALIVERAQKYGLGDYRPEYGAFDASLFDAQNHKVGVNGDARKLRNHIDEAAHETHVRRVKVSA